MMGWALVIDESGFGDWIGESIFYHSFKPMLSLHSSLEDPSSLRKGSVTTP